jgi:hypothetical protein
VRGFTWAVAIWAVLVVAVAPGGFRAFIRTGRVRISRPHLAILLVLLGTHSNAARTGAEDVLANPLVVETMLRGVLDVLALALVAPTLSRGIRRAAATRGMMSLGALTVYVVVAGASVLYSVAPFPTAGKVFELGVGLTVVWAIALDREPGDRLREAVRFVLQLEIVLLLVAVVGFLAMPGIFSELQNRPGFFFPATMVAPYAHSNGLSATGALVAAYGFARALAPLDRASRWKWLAIGLLGTVAMLLASGRQGLVIWAVATAVLLWTRRRRWFLAFVPAAALLALTQWNAIWASIWEIAARDQQPGTLATWSGRLTYWDAAVQSWLDHPWTGYGFGVGGRFVALRGIGEDSVSSLHSGYMEALVGLGLLGVVPLAFAVVRTTVWCLRRLGDAVDTPYAILIVPLLLHSLVSLGLAGWLTADFLIFACLAAIGDAEGRARRRRPTVQEERATHLPPGPPRAPLPTAAVDP